MCTNIGFALDSFAHKKEQLLSEVEREEVYDRLFKLTDRLPGVVYQFRMKPDGSTSFPFSSNAMKEILHLTPEEVYSDASSFYEVIHPEDLDDVLLSIQASAKSMTVWHKEFRVKFQDGSVRWLSGDSMPEKEDGSILWHGFMTDITEQKQTLAQVVLASKVFEQSREGIMITDADQNIVMVNQAFTDISGFSAEEALGNNPKLLSSGKHSEQFYLIVSDNLKSKGFWQGEIWNRRKNGEIYPEWLSISKGLNHLGQVSEYVAIFSDISKIKEDEEKIQRLAHYDSLTNLVNRQLMMDRLDHAISSANRSKAPVSLLFIDLDHFKNVNDTLGHHIGDELLVDVANRMSGLLRVEDTLARQGGDEFIVVLPGVGEAGASHVAEKILNEVSKRIKIGAYELFITPSIGVAVYPQDGEDVASLLKNADAAMYQAKDDGRNTYRFFTHTMQQRASRLMLIENALRTALSRNELSLNYQPQVCTKTGRIVGAEALLRWTHPEIGVISPIEFIAVAEQSGQILALSQWVLRTALQYLKSLLDQGHAPFIMAVNLSAVDFQQIDLPEKVMKVIEEINVSPENLALELTESVAMANAEMAIEMMSKLTAKGIKIAIDDFGTGYSSLSYLKRLNASKVKIDQSFVRGLTNNDEDKAIVKAIISLASSLGLKTIAEGVETEGQLAFLKDEGCDQIQGYYFSKPLSADDFRRYLTTNQS
jgi:diguanylate cyclase (GGDEF)-like protein/PAS domain S-box-containing protein